MICLVGSPGVGKTSFAKSVATALSREFAKITLGGVDDPSEIIGHRKTYVGSEPGKIVKELRRVGTSNPVFLIDEIDKIGKGINGNPASTLLDILDINQNNKFVDNYIDEEIDLSNVLFILTANNEEDIYLPLKNRIEIYNVEGYTEIEKTNIAQNYLLPQLCEKNGLKTFSIEENLIKYIVKNYTTELGVRELYRQLDKITRKVATEELLYKKRIYSLSLKMIEKYLGFLPSRSSTEGQIGVTNGLACNSYTGKLINIETTNYKGNGNIILTGNLGESLKESAQIAISYLKANYKKYNIKYEDLTSNDIHIHIPEGSIYKDGPSAGLAIVASVISLFTGKKIKESIALTGEITLNGNLVKVGGIKEKSIGAFNNDLKAIILPYDNRNDVNLLPLDLKNSINYIFVKTVDEIIKYIF